MDWEERYGKEKPPLVRRGCDDCHAAAGESQDARNLEMTYGC